MLSEGKGAELEKMTEDSSAKHGKLLPDVWNPLMADQTYSDPKKLSVPLTLCVHRLLDILEIVHKTTEKNNT